MKFNGATFNKAQQDQLKKKVGAELEDVIKKVDNVDSRMLNYTGDWVTGNEYHEKDVVTWADDGHLYEVIKAHTSSATLKPSNTTYYKAMTARKYVVEVKKSGLESFFLSIDRKSIVDIEMTIDSIGVHPIIMSSRPTSLIAFIEYNSEDGGGGAITFGIVIAHIVGNSVIAKEFDFGADGTITTKVVNVPSYFTITFVK